jgi:predicted dehydrogenase
VARGYLPAVSALGWQTLILDLDTARAERVARLYGRAIAPGVQLSELELRQDDVVVVATPPASHAELALAALEAGSRCVLVEKPPYLHEEELRRVSAAAEGVGASVTASFLRRAWHGVAVAYQRFPAWRDRLGPLRQAAVVEGQPWAWPSVATLQRGSAGLQPMLADELPHLLDALFHITRWNGITVRGERTLTNTPWCFRGSVEVLHPANGPPITLTIRGSRRSVLANAISLRFEDGEAAVEMSWTGGVTVRTAEGPRVEVPSPRTPRPTTELFEMLLRGAAGDSSGPALKIDAREWAGPLQVMSALRQAPAAGGTGPPGAS